MASNGSVQTPQIGENNETRQLPHELSGSQSNHTLETTIETESDLNTLTRSKVRPRPNRNSTAYVKNYRLSRYNNALNAAKPFRRTPITGTDELPVDSIGCISTIAFGWVRRYRVREPIQPKKSKKKPAPGELPTDAPPPEPVADGERKTPILLPRVTVADSCEVNAKRLLGLYKYEEQSKGRISSSMLRVAWQFCRTRVIIACLLQTLSHLFAVLFLSLFLGMIMDAIDASWNTESEANTPANRIIRRNSDENWKIWYFIVASVLCFIAMAVLKSASLSISLRTAVRLRTACIGAAFSRSLKSSVRNNVAPHQVISLCADESNILTNMVIKGPHVVSHSLGLMFCVIAAVVSLGGPGMWPIFGIFGIFILGGIVAIVSSINYRRSQSFLSKKLSVVEEYFNNFNTSTREFLEQHDSFKKRFASALSAQYLALSKSELFRPSSSGGITLVILLGGTYLVWCDLQFDTETTPMTNLVIMYSLLVPTMVAEICDAFQAIAQGMGVLSKVKNAIILSSPELPKMRPSRDLKVSISDATFRWDRVQTPSTSMNSNNNELDVQAFTLQIENLTLPKQNIIGITGDSASGKTSLIYALLGHLSLRLGEFYQKDKCSFYPEIPYTLDGGSIRENIVFFDEWDERRYRSTLAFLDLHFNVGFDETPIEDVRELLLLQKISMARALYSDRDTVILEEPLSAFTAEIDISDTFEMVTNKLLEIGKTVVVVSQNENILKHCNRIYLLTNGKTHGIVDYEEAQQIPAFQEVIESYKHQKKLAREEHQKNSVNLHTTLNISTEDLVNVDKPDEWVSIPMPINVFQSFLLFCLTVLNALIVVMLAFCIAIYFTNLITPSPWGVMAVFCLIPIIFTTNLLSKYFVNKIGRHYIKNSERTLFAKLLANQMADQHEVRLSQILNSMMDNNLTVFQVRASTLYIWTVIFFSFLLSILGNGFVFFFMVLPIVEFWLRFKWYWRTIERYGEMEAETRQKLLHLVANQLKGRVVIQSFDSVQKFRAKIYNAIEENSTAFFIGRSASYYNQLRLLLQQAMTLSFLMVLLTFYPYVHSIYYAFEVYVFMMVVFHLNQLLDLRFDGLVAEQKLSLAHIYTNAAIVLPDNSTL